MPSQTNQTKDEESDVETTGADHWRIAWSAGDAEGAAVSGWVAIDIALAGVALWLLSYVLELLRPRPKTPTSLRWSEAIAEMAGALALLRTVSDERAAAILRNSRAIVKWVKGSEFGVEFDAPQPKVAERIIMTISTLVKAEYCSSRNE